MTACALAAPVASPATVPPPANPDTGRDEKGRFTRGNPGGPGNPFARQSAALRAAAVQRLKPEDVGKVIDVLLELSLMGDVSAARLLLAYTIGKPGPAADPDRLDLDEWRLAQQSRVPDGEETMAVYSGMPVHLALEIARTAAPQVEERLLGQMLGGLATQERRDQKRANAASDRHQTVGNGSLPATPQVQPPAPDRHQTDNNGQWSTPCLNTEPPANGKT